MGIKAEKKAVRNAMVRRVQRDLAMVKEIKRFPFRVRLTIAWQIIKGEKT